MAEIGKAQPGFDAGRTGVTVSLIALTIVVLVLGIWRLRPDNQPSLVIVGDSVTEMSEPAIKDELDGSYHLDIQAYPGQQSSELVLVLLEELMKRDHAGEQLDRAALLVGYNDVLRDSDHPEDVENLVRLASGAACAVVLTVPAQAEWSAPDKLEEAHAAINTYNERLIGEVEKYDNVHLVTVWQDEVEASTQGELIEDDGIHPLPAGQKRLAEIYAKALEDLC